MSPKIATRKSKAKVKKRRRRKRCSLLLLLIVILSLWLGYKQIKSYLTPPSALFVLGGHEEREQFAARLAQQHPDLPIWISSGSPEAYVRQIFTNAGVGGDRLHLDYQAQDTVTNFTSLVDELRAYKINSVYLITSKNHMARARIIGEIVFGSRNIIIKPISVPTKAAPESKLKCLRDGVRAIIWLITGHTGISLAQFK